MTDTEFWRYGETVEGVARFYLELRYRLLPYTYALAAEASAAGMPLIRPLVFDFPNDPKALDQVHAYMFGSAFHVAPVLAEGVKNWDVYLPVSQGGWYDFWTGEHREGGQTHAVPVALDRIPLHVRAGSILPLGPVGQSTAGLLGGALDLLVYPGRDGATSLYEDDGLSYRCEQGAASRTTLEWDQATGVLTLGVRRGTYPGMTKNRKIRAHLVRPGSAALSVSSGTAVDYAGRSKKLDLGT
jgi:alpha-D-xyloside xylohydrolase